MRHPKKQSRLARIFGRLVRCESGGGDVIAGLLMTGIGIMAVSQTITPLREACNTAGDALKRQAGVLARGSDTGSVNGSSGLGSGSSGFDFGSTVSTVEGVVGSVGGLANQFAKDQGTQNGANGVPVTGSVKP